VTIEKPLSIDKGDCGKRSELKAALKEIEKPISDADGRKLWKGNGGILGIGRMVRRNGRRSLTHLWKSIVGKKL
jgi:hypothetical protein